MKSIILRDHEVRFLIDGRLTQLRRAVKPQPVIINHEPRCARPGELFVCPDLLPTGPGPQWCFVACESVGTYRYMGADVFAQEFCPLGVPGEQRWVRETWFCATGEPGPTLCHYRADGDRDEFQRLWRSSATMPRWASRLTVEVVRTWVERVQEISEFDARAMGMRVRTDGPNIVASVRRQWNSDNPRNPWDANPWAWAVEVKRVES